MSNGFETRFERAERKKRNRENTVGATLRNSAGATPTPTPKPAGGAPNKATKRFNPATGKIEAI